MQSSSDPNFASSTVPFSFSSPSTAAAASFPLYKDVLQSVMQFFNAKELHSVVQVCHQWCELVHTMHPLSLSILNKAIDRIPIPSRVARHVARAQKLEFSTRLQPDFIRKIISILPNLTYLKAFTSDEVLKDDAEAGFQLALPAKLEAVELGCFTMHHFSFHTRLLHALTPLSQLRKVGLMFYGQNASIKNIDFSCLINRLPLLQTFLFSFVDLALTTIPAESEVNTLSPSFVQFVRQSSLTDLFLYAEYGGIGLPFSRLADQLTSDGSPCPLLKSLTSIDINHAIIDSAVLQSLTQFPQLATLTISGNRIESDQIHHLHQLRNLTHLTLDRQENSKYLNFPEESVQICKNCPQLRRLTLDSLLTLNSEQLDECLSYLPQLTHLEINNCKALKSIAALSKHEIPKRLKHLRLEMVEVSESDVILFIMPLKQLQHLLLWTVGVDRYSEDVKAQLKVGSLTCGLPHLVESHVINVVTVPREILFE